MSPHKIPYRRGRAAITAALAAMLMVIALSALPGSTAAVTWSTVTVDTGSEYLGIQSSLALDADDRPHIAYGTSAGGLRYASWDGASWVIQTIDATATAYAYPALCLDSSGIPHVAYIGGGDVRYAAWDGASWVIQTIETGGDFTSMVHDLDRPHIAYRHVATNQLRYASWDGASWTIEIVDQSGASQTAGTGTSIALDRSGNLGIAYAAGQSGNAMALRYANQTGGTWTWINVGDNVYKYSTYRGGSISLAYDHDCPRIAYQRAGSYTSLGYASWDGASWSSAAVVTTSNNIGLGASLAIDPDGHAHISMVHHDGSAFVHAYATDTGGAWSVQQIAAYTSPDAGNARAEARHSIALDSHGIPHTSLYSRGVVQYVTVPYWAPHWTSSPPESVTVKHDYSYTPTINETGTIAAVEYPYWMTWDGSTLSGTPTALGTWPVSITAQSTLGMGEITQSWDITVQGWRPAFTTNALVSAVVGKPYSYTPGINETGTITILASPDWMTWSGGTLSGTPTETGSWALSIRAVGPGLLAAYQNVTVSASQWPPSWVSEPSYRAIVDMPYIATPAINETGAISVHTLPPWLTWDGSTMSGTPTLDHLGAWPYSISAVGYGGQTAWLNGTITVYDRDRWMPLVSSNPPVSVEVATSYLYEILTNETVTISYSGPGWLHLSGMTLSGTAPPVPGTYHVTLRITSVAGTLAYIQQWDIVVTAEPPRISPPPRITVPPGESYDYEFGGGGWGQGGDRQLTLDDPPDWIEYDPINGTISGTPPPGPGGVTHIIHGNVTNTTTGASTPVEIPIVIPPADPPAIESGHQDPSTGGTPTDTIWAGHPYSHVLIVHPERCTVTMSTDAGWLHYDDGNRTAWGTPQVPGTYHVSLRVYDPLTTLISYDNWTIVVIAEPPTVISSSSWSLSVNQSWSYVLAYRPADALVTVETEAAWISWDASTRTIGGRPPAAGVYTIIVTVANATTGMEAVQTIAVTVTLDAPVIVANPPRTAMERTLYQWTASCNQVVTWTISGEATWLTMGAGNGRVSGTPSLAGTYTITVTATNDRGVSSSYTYELTVQPYKSSGDGGSGGSGDSGGGWWGGGSLDDILGGRAGYSTSIEGPVIAFVVIGAILLLILFRRRE